jgi:hypothetical protein
LGQARAQKLRWVRVRALQQELLRRRSMRLRPLQRLPERTHRLRTTAAPLYDHGTRLPSLQHWCNCRLCIARLSQQARLRGPAPCRTDISQVPGRQRSCSVERSSNTSVGRFWGSGPKWLRNIIARRRRQPATIQIQGCLPPSSKRFGLGWRGPLAIPQKAPDHSVRSACMGWTDAAR